MFNRYTRCVVLAVLLGAINAAAQTNPNASLFIPQIADGAGGLPISNASSNSPSAAHPCLRAPVSLLNMSRA
jgi:hypothetical protein